MNVSNCTGTINADVISFLRPPPLNAIVPSPVVLRYFYLEEEAPGTAAVSLLTGVFKCWVVTPLRGDRNPSRQQLLERPEMIGQPQNHRRRPPLVAIHAFPTRQPQSPMGSLEVVIEELQAYQRIPGSIPFGEGVRLAGKGIEPIPQGAVESFDMHRPGWLQRRPQRGADLD